MPNRNTQILLTDATGAAVPYELIGICEFKHREYIILLPVDDSSAGQPIAMLIDGDEDNESYYLVQNPIEEQRIIAAFKTQQICVEYPGDSSASTAWTAMLPRQARGWQWWLLLLFRLVIPTVSLLVLRPYFMQIYIAPLNKILPPSSIASFLHVVHLLAIRLSGDSNHWRGIRYELSMAVLPTEICLCFFFMQHHFYVFMGLFVAFLLGFIGLIIFRKPLSQLFVRSKLLSKDFVLDMAATTGTTNYPKYFLRIAYRRYLAIAAAALMLIPSLMTCYIYGLKSVGHIKPIQDEIITLQENEMIFDRFIPDRWQLLTDDEKLETLQIVADIEVRRLHIDPVFVLPMDDQGTLLGQHLYESRYVFIDLHKEDHLDPMQCIDTILHECRHVYQSDCINSLDWSDSVIQTSVYFRDVRFWRSEMLDYKSSQDVNENFDAYYYQHIEVDARKYAHEASAFYEHLRSLYE